MTEKISTQKARQGRSGMNIFYVLIGGLALSFLIFFLFEAFWN